MMKALLVVMLCLLLVPQNGQARPILVELFTSQGCSSCPPADEFLGQLAGRHDVIPLSYHVDYWNSPAWNDPHSMIESTERQQGYNVVNFKRRGNYTPQMVVDGMAHETGSARTKVELLIIRAKRQAKKTWRDVPIYFTKATGSMMRVKIGDKGGEYQNRPLDVFAVAYDDKAHTGVRGGENSFRSITNHNIVRDIKKVGTWAGKEQLYMLDMSKIAEADNLIVFLQEKGYRNISGLNTMRLKKSDTNSVTASSK